MNVVVILAYLIVFLSLCLTHTHVPLLFRWRFYRFQVSILFPFLGFWFFMYRFLKDWLLLGGTLSLDVSLVWFYVLGLFVESVALGNPWVFLEWVMVVLYVVLQADFHVLQSTVQVTYLSALFPFLFNPFHLKLFLLLELHRINLKTQNWQLYHSFQVHVSQFVDFNLKIVMFVTFIVNLCSFAYVMVDLH